MCNCYFRCVIHKFGQLYYTFTIKNNLAFCYHVFMSRNRGFTAPIVLLLTLFFLILPILFWYSVTANSRETVKGSSIIKDESSVPVKIVSPKNTWDLHQYLCKDKKECLSSLYSGKRYTTTSGGSTSGYFVSLSKPQTTNEYSFLKIFVQANVVKESVKYKIIDTDLLASHAIEITPLTEANEPVDAVLIPIEFFANTTGAIESIEFISE
jgi:hypothetical protein